MASSAPLLRPEQFERYRRHLCLPESGVEGGIRQERPGGGIALASLGDDVLVVNGTDNIPTRDLSRDAEVPR
jgi:molybdopterin/thiamine biosynthesis adenylyltransferase